MFYPQAQPYFIEKQVILNDKMRLAWSQHVYWTRMFLLSLIEKRSDLAATQARLMQNPADIGKVFADYYPPETVAVIVKLLTEHLQIAAELVTALRDGQTAQAEAKNTEWYKNADEMAKAFSGINPHYDYEALRAMLYKHLDLTKQEAALRLAGDYPADIKAFDMVEQEAMMMADFFSAGLRQQFPELFT
ncbi:MAG: acetylglutamate kinase [Oscillospiraceae bacterium]|nr:acetylglutamate kinase [Oscillospiraceae bacterium]